MEPSALNEEILDDLCPICHISLSDSEENGMPTIIPCGHIYHIRCIEEVARHTSVCPDCRTPFTIPGVEPAPNKENVSPNVGCKTATQESGANNSADEISL